MAVSKYIQIVRSNEKLSSFCSWALATRDTNRVIISATPIDQTYHYHVLIRVHMFELSVGKGHQVILLYTSNMGRYSYSSDYCCSVWGVCALEF